MKYIKLNKNWNAQPNVPQPYVTNTDEGIDLSFFLNPLLFQHIDEDDKGTLKFLDVYAYRLGATGEEGYNRGEFRYKNAQLPWGEFYELLGSNWKNDFPDDKQIINEKANKSKLRHFIFFLKEETFECLAIDYQYAFVDKISEALEVKYPKGYLNHYLAMFSSQFDKPTIENYKMYTDLYLQMQSKKEFAEVQKEVKSIKANNDLDSYLKIANYFGIERFEMKQLKDMIKVIETYKA
jgi:hypothetical protein